MKFSFSHRREKSNIKLLQLYRLLAFSHKPGRLGHSVQSLFQLLVPSILRSHPPPNRKVCLGIGEFLPDFWLNSDADNLPVAVNLEIKQPFSTAVAVGSSLILMVISRLALDHVSISSNVWCVCCIVRGKSSCACPCY